MTRRTELEDELARQYDLAKIRYEREVSIVPGRRFRWDFRIQNAMILVEVQGGIWQKGGHSTGTGITRDCEKNNLALLAGYSTLLVTGEHIRSGQALRWTQDALK